MNTPITREEARVLGCLLEKELATPEYYPLTPSSLLAACNQLSNREPVVSYDQSAVDHAAMQLRRKGMAAMVHMAGSRVGKLRHLLEDVFPALGKPERAVLAVLLLRGPQTSAELRSRTERMHLFASAEDVERSLTILLDNAGQALAAHLPPGGGRRVSTYAHLLCGECSAAAVAEAASVAVVVPPPPDVLAGLEQRLAVAEARVANLERRLSWIEEALGSKAPDQTLSDDGESG